MTEKEIPIDDPSLTSEVTYPELHEQTLNQVLLTPVQLGKDDRNSVRLYDVIGYNNTKDAIAFIATSEDLSFSSVLTTTLVHGWAIMSHEHSDVFKKILSLRNNALCSNYRMFHQVKSGLTISPQFCNNTFIGFIDDKMHDDIVIKSDLLRISMSKYATICLCMSLQDCDYIIPEYQKVFRETVTFFNYNCNVLVKILDDIKY